jgi:hypothetical protein
LDAVHNRHSDESASLGTDPGPEIQSVMIKSATEASIFLLHGQNGIERASKQAESEDEHTIFV